MDEGFVRRTYRSAAVVTAIVLFVLASYGQFWAILPVLTGALMGGLLLYALEVFVRGAFTPERAERAAAKKKNGKVAGPWRALLGFGLVKYPLVALLIWAVTRFWQIQEVMAFTGGFILIQAVIVLRGVGRSLVDKKEDPPVSGDRGTGRKE